MRQIKSGSLKCVVLGSVGDRTAIVRELIARVGSDDVQAFGGAAIIVHTDEPAATVRDWTKVAASALVVEFETWSGSGDDVPREWLLARGH